MTLSSDTGAEPRGEQGKGEPGRELCGDMSAWRVHGAEHKGSVYKGHVSWARQTGARSHGPLQAGGFLMDFLIALERVQLKPRQGFKWDRAVI